MCYAINNLGGTKKNKYKKRIEDTVQRNNV